VILQYISNATDHKQYEWLTDGPFNALTHTRGGIVILRPVSYTTVSIRDYKKQIIYGEFKRLLQTYKLITL
jgi:hypothetical protein